MQPGAVFLEKEFHQMSFCWKLLHVC